MSNYEGMKYQTTNGVSEQDLVFNNEHNSDTILDAFVVTLNDIYDYDNDEYLYANSTELSAYIDPILYQYEIVNGTRKNEQNVSFHICNETDIESRWQFLTDSVHTEAYKENYDGLLNYIRDPIGTQAIAFCLDDPQSIELEITMQNGNLKKKNLALELKTC